MSKVFRFDDLPKISLNEWYSGKHWSERVNIKNSYRWLIKSKVKTKLPKNKKYQVDYEFHFEKNPLDASNTVAMIKLIEDSMFENDAWNVIIKLSSMSVKDKSSFVIVNVTELDAAQ
jgi:hypothetical protein